MSTNPEKPIGVVCRDAGGANQVFAQLLNFNQNEVSAFVEGPAQYLWQRAFKNKAPISSLSELLSNSKTLITGAGAGTIEHEARKRAKAIGVYTIAVLDHWTNYAERFVREGERILPDEMWVVDEYALNLATKTFPSQKITLKPDLYAEQQLRLIQKLPKNVQGEILYLLEPINFEIHLGKPVEFRALDYFFENLPELGFPEDAVICLRPHPSDPPGKYDAYLGSFGAHRVVLDQGDLYEAISRAQFVVGCQTYAMTLALAAGKLVFCSLLPSMHSIRLPHDGLIYIDDLWRKK